MALSATRVAAFEFLIQFRSAGRGQINRGVNSIRRVARAARENTASLNASSLAATRYAVSLARSSNAARSATSTEAALTAAISAGASARLRAARAARISRARTFSNNLGLAFRSRGIQALSRVAPQRVVGRAAIGLASARTALSRLNPILAVATSSVSIFFGVIRTGIGVLFSWVKANAVVLGSVGLIATGIARLSDSYVQLTNRIRVASDGTETTAQTTNKLLDIALRSRSAFSTVADLYGRVSINAKELGVSQEDVLRLTELTTRAFKIAGGTAREEAQTVIQFAQALGSNRLSGDELRAVREQAPELSQSLARGLTALGTFGQVNVGRLKELGEDGSLTTKIVTDALLTQEREIAIRFGRVQATFADGVSNIRSSLFVLAGSIAESVKLGPRFFRFGDRIGRAFQRISSSSGEIGLAFTNLAQFFTILFGNGNAISRLIDGLGGIGEFFENLPDRILRAARSLNEFIALVNRGVGINDAARTAFGVDITKLRENFRPVNNLFDGFLDQFEKLNTSLSTIAGTMATIAGVLDRIPFVNIGSTADDDDDRRGANLRTLARLPIPGSSSVLLGL